MNIRMHDMPWSAEADTSNGSRPQSGDRFVSEALTFDDVLLVPGYADVLPSDVDISTSTRAITLEHSRPQRCHGHGHRERASCGIWRGKAASASSIAT